MSATPNHRDHPFPPLTNSTVMIDSSRSDEENVGSETDSVVVYTPSSSEPRGAGRSATVSIGSIDEELSEGEADPLLPPPRYGSPRSSSAAGILTEKANRPIDTAGLSTFGKKEPEHEILEQGGNDNELPNVRVRRCCGWRKWLKERRSKRWEKRKRILVFGKITLLLLGLASFWLFTLRCRKAKNASIAYSFENDQVAFDHISSIPPSDREIVISKGSDSISGRYPLYDLLSLSTVSGSISVDIAPQPADPKNPDKPARVVLESTSGSISVSFSVPDVASWPSSIDEEDQENKTSEVKNCTRNMIKYHDIADENAFASRLPPRPYEIDIKNKMGSVSGRFIFATQIHLQSSVGSISATLTPIIFNSSNPSSPINGPISVVTYSEKGSQNIRLTEPLTATTVPATTSHGSSSIAQPDAARSLANTATASHTVQSGSMNIDYPRSWTGHIVASVPNGAGSICLEGRGLEVIKNGQGHATATRKKSVGDVKWWGNQGTMDVSLLADSVQFFCEG